MTAPSFIPPIFRPRNRLRKSPKRTRPGSQISHSTSSPRPSMDTAASGRDSPTVAPPDLSDTKWEEFVRKSAFVQPMSKSPRLEQIPASPSPSRSLSTAAAAAADEAQQQPQPQPQQQQQLVPEFAHLALASAGNTGGGSLQPPSRNPRRSSMEGSTRVPSLRSPSSSSASTSSSSSSTTTASTRQFRRYSKTPVLRIGQLEDKQQATAAAAQVPDLPPMPKTPVPPVPRRSIRRSSGSEQVAEEYRTLLRSRTCARLRMQYEEDGNENGDWGSAAPETQQPDEDSSTTRQDSIETIRSAIARRSPVQQRRQFITTTTTPPPPRASLEVLAADGEELEPPEGSPTSDGTLVGFEEDAIYFKPAFTPEGALTPIPEDEYYGTPMGSPQIEAGDSLSLQICVNLLGKELKSAMQRRDDSSSRSSSSSSSGDSDGGLEGGNMREPLQIWTMIEAYETLKDKMVRGDTSISPLEARAVEQMFDTWLKALYWVHDGISRENAF